MILFVLNYVSLSFWYLLTYISTAVTPLLTYWSCCSLALSHRCVWLRAIPSICSQGRLSGTVIRNDLTAITAGKRFLNEPRAKLWHYVQHTAIFVYNRYSECARGQYNFAKKCLYRHQVAISNQLTTIFCRKKTVGNNLCKKAIIPYRFQWG